MKNKLKPILIVVGLISLGLGIVGIFLPILPTTPFLLLSAALFAKSSDRLYSRLINHPKLGHYILDFREHKSIPLRVKVISISMLWITISFSAIFAVNNIWLKILLFSIAIGVTIHILHFKTKK